MDFNCLSWLFAIALTVHNVEEAIWLPAWSQTAGRFHHPTGAFEFRFAVTVLTVMAYIAAYLSMTGGKGSMGAYLISGYALAMLLNTVFPHLLATLAMRRYAPGTATAILLNFPITSLLLYHGFREGFIDQSEFIYLGPLVVIGILLLIPGLFFAGRRLAGCIQKPAG
jgi:hypothetical protein